MNKILSITALTIALAGCQAGPNQAVGTGVGAVGGYATARALGAGSTGSAVGAVAGALIGNEVGRNMDQNQGYAPPPRERVIVQERPVYIREPVVQCRIVRQYDPYYNIYRNERVCRQY
jgi:osmotically inducible lipoprotein OsmB